jgi:hypothetical protein
MTSTKSRMPASRLSKAALASSAVIIAIAAPIIAASPAQAIPPDSYISSNSGGANMRTCPNTGCGSVAYLGNGTAVIMDCWVDAQSVSPPQSNYTSARWFHVSLHYDNRNGYVHSSLVTKQTSVPHC